MSRNLVAAARLSICCVHRAGTADEQPEEVVTEVKPTVAEEDGSPTSELRALPDLCERVASCVRVIGHIGHRSMTWARWRVQMRAMIARRREARTKT